MHHIRRIAPLFFALAFASLTLAASCSSTKSAEEDSDSTPFFLSNPDYEIEPYLVEREAQIMVKFRSAAWDRVEPLVSDVLTASIRDRSPAAWAESAAEGPFAFADSVFGVRLDLEHLNPDRPSYLILAPRRDNPWQGCLSAGLPCVLFEAPGPRYGRLILAAEEPSRLAGELKDGLGEGNYRIVEQQYHVRVEFAMTDAQTSAIDEHLEVRVSDDPEDDYYGRISPARASFLEHRVSFGAYADLRSLVDGAIYYRTHRLADRLGDIARDSRMERVLEKTADIARLTHLDLPEQAEYEDVAVTLGGKDESYGLRVVSTRTRFGRNLAESRSDEIELPDIQVDGSVVEGEWDLRWPALHGEVDPKKWLVKDDLQHYPSLDELGETVWLGWWRAPTAVGASLTDRYSEYFRGIDLSKIVAGRVRLAISGDVDVPGWSDLRGGVAVLLADDGDENRLANQLERFGRTLDTVEMKRVDRGEGRLEIRMALNAPLDEVFPEEGSSSAVERVSVRIPSDSARKLYQLALESGMAVVAPAATRIARGLSRNGPVRLHGLSHDTWSGLQVALGPDTPKIAKFEAPSFDLRRSRVHCLDSVAQRSATWMERAAQADDPDEFLMGQFEQNGHAFRKGLDECEGRDVGGSELAAWAGDFFDAWEALTRYRSGGDHWARKILEVCEEREWACDPEEGEWPWLRPGTADDGGPEDDSDGGSDGDGDPEEASADE